MTLPKFELPTITTLEGFSIGGGIPDPSTNPGNGCTNGCEGGCNSGCDPGSGDGKEP